MDLFSQIIHVDFIALLTAVYLFIFMRSNDAYEHKINALFKHALIILLALALFDNIDYYMAKQSTPQKGHIVILVAGYLTRVSLMVAAIFIITRGVMSKSKKIILFVPLALMAVILITTAIFFTDKLVWFESDNTIHKELFSWTPHTLSVFYFVEVVVVAVQRTRQRYMDEAVMLFVTIVAIITAVSSEIILRTRGIFIGASSLMITFYYLYLHMEHFKRDTLTGVLNRMSFFADIQKFKPGTIVALCEFDMNNLKQINDQLGHAQGDKAIITIASVIQGCLPRKSYLYRLGGDEFAALFCDTDLATVHRVIEKIRYEFSLTEYTCAIGMASWEKNSSFNEVYNKADQLMYEDKSRQKALRAPAKQ